MQRNCIFPGRYAPLTYYEDVLEPVVITLMPSVTEIQLNKLRARFPA